jgi:hypothetical protein
VDDIEATTIIVSSKTSQTGSFRRNEEELWPAIA